jgi:nuclear pore complex protein Nup53
MSNFDSPMAITRVSQNTPHTTPEPLYVVVFGYPPDKYSVAIEYFKQLGETTDPDLNTEISNCFKIGFKNPVDAVWAVRKNGEVVGGSWMVGVKWAVRHISRRCEVDSNSSFQDSSQAERVLGQSVARVAYPLAPPDVNSSTDIVFADSAGPSRSPPTARTPHNNTPTVGTPIQLAPSASAFRKPGQVPKAATSMPGLRLAAPAAVGTPGTPSKSMIGQFSDFVFGW